MKYIEADSKTLCLHFSILKTKRSSKPTISKQSESCQQMKQKNTHQQPYDETQFETAKINNIK
jgi:hypothetical protein